VDLASKSLFKNVKTKTRDQNLKVKAGIPLKALKECLSSK
jgi:hypothetical protein